MRKAAIVRPIQAYLPRMTQFLGVKLRVEFLVDSLFVEGSAGRTTHSFAIGLEARAEKFEDINRVCLLAKSVRAIFTTFSRNRQAALKKLNEYCEGNYNRRMSCVDEVIHASKQMRSARPR